MRKISNKLTSMFAVSLVLVACTDTKQSENNLINNAFPEAQIELGEAGLSVNFSM
jgi:hypothetical protein